MLHAVFVPSFWSLGKENSEMRQAESLYSPGG